MLIFAPYVLDATLEFNIVCFNVIAKSCAYCSKFVGGQNAYYIFAEFVQF